MHALSGVRHDNEILESKKSFHIINRVSNSILSGFVIDVVIEKIFKLKVSFFSTYKRVSCLLFLYLELEVLQKSSRKPIIAFIAKLIPKYAKIVKAKAEII